MRFSGRYSTALSEGSALLRAGYIGCNNVLPKSLDLSMHDFLEFRIRSGIDHTYVASVRTDNYTGGDEEVWQAPLRPARPGEWESLRVPFNELIYTVRGKVGSNQSGGRMPRHAVMAVGLTLPVTKDMGEEGDFCLDFASVEAKAEHLRGGAAQQKAFQGYLSSHEDPKTVDGFASRPKISSPGSSTRGEGVIGGRKLRKPKGAGEHVDAQLWRGSSGSGIGVEVG
ncbi:hypothetical protein DUNSADRAFT_3144 [Dunaliella salina]|uniref:NADH:ubiquinone oxidoreductase intermediate-associated protein 30 domain-containing protein n=1 Tax=Dunaliella salina TaxID=3046 RepID=A0ABQ7H833_DUNSA|nr:hypothetical protein DUNSADRAFT_3144 [Dunaliella salina]|eukprot:KAF5843015.1 hypothetical protein DUNSADRAFT_3144 [Dunaliella salina]